MLSPSPSLTQADSPLDSGPSPTLSSTGYGLDLDTTLFAVQQRIQSLALSSSAFDQLSQVFDITDSVAVQAQRIFGNPEKGYEKPQASLRSMMRIMAMWMKASEDSGKRS